MKLLAYFIISLIFIYAGTNASILFLFLAFVPALIIASSNYNLVYRTFLITSIIFAYTFFSTPWFVDMYGWIAIFILCFITIIFTLPFIFAFSKKNKSNLFRLLIFISSWITIEFILLKVDFIPPFHILGNLFWSNISYIKFYEYTGVLGGTLWILLVNSALFLCIKSKKNKQRNISITLLLLSIVWIFMSHNNLEKINQDNLIKVCFFHLNNDDKLAQEDSKLVRKLIKLMDNKINNDVQFIIFPENTLTSNNRLEFLQDNLEFFYLQKFAALHPNNKIIIGAEIIEYDIKTDSLILYNSAIVVDEYSFNLISKERFVPFEEKTPSIFKLFTDQTGDYIKKETSHYVDNGRARTGVLICYEALYGAYVGQKTGDASYLALLTRECGIAQHSKITKQYLGITKIRAIEQQKSIIKSSNSGYSALIYPNGKVKIIISPESETTPVIADVPISKKKTIYAKYGDWIGILAAIASFMIIVSMIIDRYIRLRSMILHKHGQMF